ncbi:hypothetical protein [Bradyrhizobium sp. BR 1432]|uniref:hypothetical protein n=1 Tax=Bradyrhizobium sp. BR 1432 TaxID=3447966 RepID=UPI003EE54B3E
MSAPNHEIAMMQTAEVDKPEAAGGNDRIGYPAGLNPGPAGLPLTARMAYDAATQKSPQKTP